MANWKNRIIGSGELPASDFLANPLNWRIHPKPQQESMKGVLNEVGWIQEVIVNQQTGNMIDGHLRVTLALREGDDTPVPVKFVDLSPAEEALALATLDPIGAMAAADAQQLDTLMQDIQTGEAGLQEMLGELAEDNGLYFGDEPQTEGDTEPEIDRAEELRQQYGVESGQMWQLGEHRLICGDCTDAAVVERVMDGERAELCFTDPPYGVSKAFWDNEFLIEWIANAWSVSDRLLVTPGNTFLVDAANAIGQYVDCLALYATNGMTKSKIAFGNFTPVLACGNWKWEARKNVIEYAVELSEDIAHPSPKPLRAIERLFKDYSGGDWLIFDCFSGSGTTLIAAENLSRRCRAIEIDPGYCAVTIHRWETHTGKQAQLIQDLTL